MKIGTIRLLIIVADLGFITLIGLVVKEGLQLRDSRQDRTAEYMADVMKQLDSRKSGPSRASTAIKYGDNIAKLTHTPPKKVEEKPPEVARPTSAKPPLETLLKVIGIQTGPGEPPSRAFLVKKDAQPAKPEDAGRDLEGYVEGQIVEWAEGAIVRKVRPTEVVFDYDGKEVLVHYEPPKAVAGAPAAGAAPAGAPKGPPPVPNDTPSTWVTIEANRPNLVNVTEVGLASLNAKGEASLEGVRWSTETLPDGKAGLRLDEVPDQSVLKTGGAQTGDVLHSVNGVRMSTKGEIVEYVRRNQGLSRYVVKFYRAGILYERTITVPRN